MKAMVINRYGDANVLEPADIPVPDPQPGEVLVRIASVAVNPADGKWRSGMFESFAPVPFPHVLGYDVAGVVERGDGFAPSTRLFGMLDPYQKGGYAEYVSASADLFAPIPDGLDFPTAAAIPTAGLAGVQLVEKGVNVQPGKLILITGALGAVGRFALYAAKSRGARVVAAVRGEHRDAILALGADDVVILGEQAWQGETFDHVIDTVGGPAVALLCQYLRQGGKIVTAATTAIPTEGLNMVPEFFAVKSSRADLVRIADAVAGGAITVPIAQIMPLDRAAEAQRMVELGGQGGKIILAP